MTKNEWNELLKDYFKFNEKKKALEKKLKEMNAAIKTSLEAMEPAQNGYATAEYMATLQLKDHRIAWNEASMEAYLGDDFVPFKKDCYKRAKGKTKSLTVTKNAA